MKKKLLLFFVIFLSNFIFSQEIQISNEMKEKYKLKPHHEKLSIDCSFCHINQGSDPAKFKEPNEKACLACHKSKEYLAKRLEFMDSLKANPHNSIHDGTSLFCDECHHSHKKSENMCEECHQKEIQTNLWMKEVP